MTVPSRLLAAPRPSRAGRFLVLAMFLPCVGLLAFAIHQRTRGPERESPFAAPAAPERLSATGDISGWETSVEVRGVCRLAARLEALHPGDERQSFDALALARALRPELPQAAIRVGERQDRDPSTGGPLLEPWRLTLSAFPVGDGDVPVDEVVIDALDSVEVQGLEALVPRSLRRDGPVLFDAAADPRVALFSPPAAPLVVGESHDLILWGRRPSFAKPLRVRVPGLRAPLLLEPSVRTGRRTTQSIAFEEGLDSAPNALDPMPR